MNLSIGYQQLLVQQLDFLQLTLNLAAQSLDDTLQFLVVDSGILQLGLQFLQAHLSLIGELLQAGDVGHHLCPLVGIPFRMLGRDGHDVFKLLDLLQSIGHLHDQFEQLVAFAQCCSQLLFREFGQSFLFLYLVALTGHQ